MRKSALAPVTIWNPIAATYAGGLLSAELRGRGQEDEGQVMKGTGLPERCSGTPGRCSEVQMDSAGSWANSTGNQ